MPAIAALAGLVGIFSGTITGSLGVGKFTGLIVPALGAALIGGMASIPLAAAGGLLIGLADADESHVSETARHAIIHIMAAIMIEELAHLVIGLHEGGEDITKSKNSMTKRNQLDKYTIYSYSETKFIPISVTSIYGVP